MTVQIVHSPSSAERLEETVAFLRSHPPGTEIVIVAASREAADDLVRRLAGDGVASFGLHRFTLLQLASQLAAPELAQRGLAPLTALGTISIAARLTFEAERRGQVRYFEPVARCPGFSRALATTLGELRLAGARPAALRGISPAADDLAALLDLYQEQLAGASLADRTALLDLAATAAADGSFAFRGAPLLLLDVPVRSPAERAFVAALCGAAGEALATIAAGDGETMAAMAPLGAVTQAGATAVASAPGLARLRSYLFSQEPPPSGPLDDEVCFFSAPGEGRECVEIARKILEEARGGASPSGAIPFDQIAVFLRAPEIYSPLLAAAFRRAAIPAYFARGSRRPDPTGRAFLSLLACLSEGLSARRFAEYLAFAQVPDLDCAGAPPANRELWAGSEDDAAAAVAAASRQAAAEASSTESPSEEKSDGSLAAPWRWEELLVEAAVLGGADRWRRRLDGLENELALQLEELRARDPEPQRIEARQRELDNLRHLKSFAVPVIDYLAAQPAQQSWGAWLNAFARLAPMVLRRPQRVLRVLAELEPMAEVGPVSIDEVHEVLADRLSTLEEDPPAYRYGRVFVGTAEEARGRSFAVVFVPGLAERLFPQRPREDPLLLDGARRRLDIALRTQDERVDAERLLLRLAVGAAQRRVVLSYPRVDVAEARPRVTSFYGLDVARATRGTIPDFEQLERQAAAEVQARLAWPAPPDPRRAVDPIEHDLAVLGGLLHQTDPSKSRGRARYLLQLNQHLGRSLRTRWSRWRSGWSAYDGLVRSTETTAAALAASRLAARPYSVSALQRYAVCPYQFLLSAIHRLEPRPQANALERLDPLTRGAMFHRVQAETLRQLRAQGALPCGDASLGDARAALDQILDEVAGQVHDQVAPPILRVWQDEIAAMRADLRAWLTRTAESGGEWEPLYFELGFGLPPSAERDTASREDPVTLPGGAVLRGSIDLIERSRRDQLLRVTDYKTGSDHTAAGMRIGGGEILQPVLYSLAVEARTEKPVAEARLFFCTSRGGFGERTVVIDDAARASGREVLEIIDRAIAGGVLPPAPRQDACKTCDFRCVCGPYEEIRVQSKDRALLADLLELRSRP